jgi:hypothetical protein
MLGDPATGQPIVGVRRSGRHQGDIDRVPFTTQEVGAAVASATPPSPATLTRQPATVILPTSTATVENRVTGTARGEINVRYGPGVDYPRIGVAQAGVSFEVTRWHTQFPWVQIAIRCEQRIRRCHRCWTLRAISSACRRSARSAELPADADLQYGGERLAEPAHPVRRLRRSAPGMEHRAQAGFERLQQGQRLFLMDLRMARRSRLGTASPSAALVSKGRHLAICTASWVPPNASGRGIVTPCCSGTPQSTVTSSAGQARGQIGRPSSCLRSATHVPDLRARSQQRSHTPALVPSENGRVSSRHLTPQPDDG